MTPLTVVKLGGSSFDHLDTMLDFVESLSETRVVLVHGGGPQISSTLSKLGHTPTFFEGLRVTDEETLETVEMVLAGKVNKRLVAALIQRGLPGVGVSGVDGATLCSELEADGALGFVGGLPKVDSKLLELLLSGGFLPVVAPLSLSPTFISLNVNADTSAAAIAVALRARRLIFLSDTAGVLDQSGATIMDLDSARVAGLKRSGVVSSGMIPKLEAALYAVGHGVAQVEIRSPGPTPGTRVTGEKGNQHVSAFL